MTGRTRCDGLVAETRSCEHTFVPSPTDAFLTRLLDLVPIYYEAGREIARLSPPSPAPSATALAGAACSRWLLPAIPADAGAMGPVAEALTADASPEDLLASREAIAQWSRIGCPAGTR